MGAWIETVNKQVGRVNRPVAPFVGAWIETLKRLKKCVPTWSHPSWVRGLKHVLCQLHGRIVQSHPSWVRGLKHVCERSEYECDVAPFVGAWIETDKYATANRITVSHPSWVRGLKLRQIV